MGIVNDQCVRQFEAKCLFVCFLAEGVGVLGMLLNIEYSVVISSAGLENKLLVAFFFTLTMALWILSHRAKALIVQAVAFKEEARQTTRLGMSVVLGHLVLVLGCFPVLVICGHVVPGGSGEHYATEIAVVTTNLVSDYGGVFLIFLTFAVASYRGLTLITSRSGYILSHPRFLRFFLPVFSFPVLAYALWPLREDATPVAAKTSSCLILLGIYITVWTVLYSANSWKSRE